MKLSSDYILTNEPDKSFLERHGFTQEQFETWVETGKVPKAKVKNEKDDLSDFIG